MRHTTDQKQCQIVLQFIMSYGWNSPANVLTPTLQRVEYFFKPNLMLFPFVLHDINITKENHNQTDLKILNNIKLIYFTLLFILDLFSY